MYKHHADWNQAGAGPGFFNGRGGGLTISSSAVANKTTIHYYFCDKKAIDTRSQTSSQTSQRRGCNPLNTPPGSAFVKTLSQFTWSRHCRLYPTPHHTNEVGTLKNPYHCSKRVGGVDPGVVAWPITFIRGWDHKWPDSGYHWAPFHGNVRSYAHSSCKVHLNVYMEN